MTTSSTPLPATPRRPRGHIVPLRPGECPMQIQQRYARRYGPMASVVFVALPSGR